MAISGTPSAWGMSAICSDPRTLACQVVPRAPTHETTEYEKICILCWLETLDLPCSAVGTES
jgi:hypothetical protein